MHESVSKQVFEKNIKIFYPHIKRRKCCFLWQGILYHSLYRHFKGQNSGHFEKVSLKTHKRPYIQAENADFTIHNPSVYKNGI